MTHTESVVNGTYTMPVNGSTTELLGQNVVGTDYIVTNASDGAYITSGNYTITQGLGSDGQIATLLTAVDAGNFQSKSVNVSYSYEPDGYVNESAGRAIAGLIIVFSALAIAFAVFPDLRNIFS